MAASIGHTPEFLHDTWAKRVSEPRRDVIAQCTLNNYDGTLSIKFTGA